MPVEVDTSVFSSMCKELAAKCEAPDDRVLRFEVGRVLTRAVELTPAADVSKIRRHSTSARYSLQSVSLYTPKRKRRAKLKGGRIVYRLSNRYPNALWQKISRKRAIDVKARLAARGLSKGSWWKIGELLGVPVDAPAYAKKAVPSTGKLYPQDEKARTIHENGAVGIEIENSQPTVFDLGGEQILRKAIDGRTAYYVTNVEKEVFDSLDRIAKKYPGVTTTNG